MVHLGDITKLHGAKIQPVDVITFGSPCQDLSIAGKRAGMAGERSGLFFEAVRIIREMRLNTWGLYPKFAVWENVPGAYSSNKGDDFHAVLESLCQILNSDVSIPRYAGNWPHRGAIVANDYSLAWRTMDAQYWGVPQRRRRITLVLDLTGQRAGEVLFKPESLRRDFTTLIEAWKATARNTPYRTAGYDCMVDTEKRRGDILDYTLKIRSGCNGGGKGALVQTEKSATLSALQDQTLFVPTAFGLCSMQIGRAHV